MRSVKFLIIGIIFGIIMYKSEAASWFRIYEMFRFQSFHMYGIIGSALLLGISGIYLIRKKQLRTFEGEPIHIAPKDKGFRNYLFGGFIFGLGWALAGSCPGPIYTLIGAGYLTIFVVLIGALIGTLVYGILRKRLPH